MGTDPPALNNGGFDACPVEGVSWADIQEFLKKLNALTGKTYRLPSEAEWEYAARGGNKARKTAMYTPGEICWTMWGGTITIPAAKPTLWVAKSRTNWAFTT